MTWRKVLGWLLGAFAVFFVLSSPVEAGHIVRSVGENASQWLSGAADALSQFVKSLA